MERATHLYKVVYPVPDVVSLLGAVNQPLGISGALVTARETSSSCHGNKAEPWFSVKWQE